MRTIRLLVVISSVISAAVASCPTGCHCGDQLIICTCQGIASGTLTLGPFPNIDYTNSLYVHSCRKLIIHTDSFAGLAISQELNIKDIEQIQLAPFAFREMLKYPERIHFLNSVISEIPPNTFAGINNVKYLWFKNVSIGHIQSGAFRLISSVEYIYFRESPIKSIAPAAFEQLSAIQNFYIRGNLKIDRIGDHIFRDSQIHETVFEAGTIASMNMYALAGAKHLEKFIIMNCTIGSTTMDKPTQAYKPIEGAGELELIKVNISELEMAPFSNWRSVRFELCRIEEILPSRFNLENVTTLHFKTSLVNYIAEQGFKGTRNVETIAFEGGAIDTIFGEAFTGSTFGTLMFLDTTMNRIQSHAFRGLTVANFIFEECTLQQELMHNSISHLNATEAIRILNSKIHNFHKRVFHNSATKYFGLENNEIGDLGDFALEGLSADIANISNNRFAAHYSDSLVGLATPELIFTFNRFQCHCNADFLRFFAFLKGRVRNECLSKESNQVIPVYQYEKMCTAKDIKVPQLMLGEGVVCKDTFLSAECKCSGSNGVLTRDHAQNFPQRISDITITDCNTLHVPSYAIYELRQLVTLRIKVLQIHISSKAFGKLRNLRHMVVDAADMGRVETEAFVELQKLDKLSIKNARITRVCNGAFAAINAGLLLFENTAIDELESDYLSADSKVGNLTFHASDIKLIHSVMGGAEVEHLLMARNSIESIRGLGKFHSLLLGKSALICAEGNEVLCHCENRGFRQLLAENHCVTAENFCILPKLSWRENAKSFLARMNTSAEGYELCHLIPNRSTNKIATLSLLLLLRVLFC